MKIRQALFIAALWLSAAGCKKNNTGIECPQVVSPANYSTFHSGDTVSFVIYLPPFIQQDTNKVFAEIVNRYYYHISDTLNLDTLLYPTFASDHRATIKLIVKSVTYGTDTNYVDTGDGSPGIMSCDGITYYIAP